MVKVTQVNSNDFHGILAVGHSGFTNLIHEGDDFLLVANDDDVSVTDEDIQNIYNAYDELLESEVDELETVLELENGQQVKVVF